MYVYIIMLIISLFFIFLSEKSNNKKTKILYAILSVIPFILVSALRYDVGTDYFYRYVPDYNSLVRGESVDNLEIGFKMLVRLCILITSDYQILFILTSIITISLFMYTIHKQSKNKFLSVAIFFLGGFFFQSLNILRQYISIVLVFFTYKYLLEKKYWIFILGVVLAFFIHNASIVCLILLLLKEKEVLNLKSIIIIALVIFIFGTPLMNIFRNIVENTRFNVYLNSIYDRGEMRILTILSNVILYIFMYMLYIVKKKNKKITNEDILYINIQGITLIFIMLSSQFYLFFRIAYYFMIFQIVSIPYFIKTIDIKELYDYYIINIMKNKIPIKENIVIKIPTILAVMIIFYFSVILTYTNILNNDEEVTPYKCIINCERENVIKDDKN